MLENTEITVKMFDGSFIKFSSKDELRNNTNKAFIKDPLTNVWYPISTVLYMIHPPVLFTKFIISTEHKKCRVKLTDGSIVSVTDEHAMWGIGEQFVNLFDKIVHFVIPFSSIARIEEL